MDINGVIGQTPAWRKAPTSARCLKIWTDATVMVAVNGKTSMSMHSGARVGILERKLQREEREGLD